MAKKSTKRANGEGSLFYNSKKKRWIGKVCTGIDENGKAKRKEVSGKTQTEVRAKMAQIKYDVHNGTFIDESQITIYQLGKQLLDEVLNLNYVKESSYFRNIDTLKRLKKIYNTPLQKATETQIKDYLLSEQVYSQSVINKEYEMLKKIFKEAEKRNIIKTSPMEDIKKPKSKQNQEKVRALTIDEQRELVKVLVNEKPQYFAQMLISLLTGMRMGEINALEVRDINFSMGYIYINKTISRGEKGKANLNDTPKTEAGNRTIKLREDVANILKEAIGARTEGIIFTSKSGGLVTTNQVNMQFQRIIIKYEILDSSEHGRVTDHSLRHTYATRAIEAGMHVKALQKTLGHTDVSITLNTYCDAFNKFEADNMKKLDEYSIKQCLTISQLTQGEEGDAQRISS